MKQIPPRSRNEVDQTFYTTGVVKITSEPSRFSKHIAEPGAAASILSRNPHHSADLDVKPITKSRSPLTDRYNPEVLSLPNVKQVQNREFSQKANNSVNCSKTVAKADFQQGSGVPNSVPANEYWLYCTRAKPYAVKAEDTFKVTDQTPDWFKLPKSSESTSKDQTLTVFSRLSGWIYVSAQSRNRKHRLGRTGPFKEGEKANFQNVSSLAPNWMQRESNSVPPNHMKNMKPPPFLRQEQKRMILVEENQPEKSLFSLGDFRHDVRTLDEVNTFNRAALPRPKNFFEWKEDVPRQKYDKPLTEKVGARVNK